MKNTPRMSGSIIDHTRPNFDNTVEFYIYFLLENVNNYDNFF